MATRNIFRPNFRKRSGGVSRIIRDNYGKTWYQTIAEVLERDDKQCQNRLFTGKCLSKDHVQVHHIKPLSKGGKTEKSNLITLCRACHEMKHPHMHH
jgi:5-methylcytosine-specific restriction endonuclease McrA